VPYPPGHRTERTAASTRPGLRLADKGWRDALRADRALALGLNTFGGFVTYPAVATDLGLPYLALEGVLG
jgi:alanine dehydrogenase